MLLTPYPDIKSFFDNLLLQLKTILADRLIGVYVFGSLVWGDFEFGSSDIDLLVVSSSDITNHEFDKLDDMQQALAKTSTHAKEGMLEIALVQEKALTLFGPPPKTLIAPTTREEFIQAVRVHANAWRNWTDGLHGCPGQAYAILTLCRAYYTSQNGEQTSKKRAAQWTAKAFPQWSTLIENALKWREDWRNNQVDAEETVPETKQFVHFILDHITH